jgi:hypothetical protein
MLSTPSILVALGEAFGNYGGDNASTAYRKSAEILRWREPKITRGRVKPGQLKGALAALTCSRT